MVRPTNEEFEHIYELAEKYGYPGNSGSWRKFDGKVYVLFNDNLTKSEADYYAKKLRSKGHSAKVRPQASSTLVRTSPTTVAHRRIVRYIVYYHKKGGKK